METTTKDHAALALEFNRDEERVNWHDETLWFIREKRDKASHNIPEWESLREAASQIKNNVLSNLHNYLVQFEKNAVDNGIEVHWAVDAEEHNQIVHNLIAEAKVTRMVKSKSMLTEECGLNEYLAEHGIEVIDSDLGERIVQLAEEPPSHIVLPCIHKRKEEIGEIFHKHLGIEAGISDPQFLTETARQHLREVFLPVK
jgi:L-lactate dehydrogenase complex protein LldF